MSTTELQAGAARPEVVTREVPKRRPAWIEVATSTDHKQIGATFIATAFAFLVLAVTELVLMKIQLIVPDATIIEYTIFDQLLSAYGATAIVLFALPLAIGFATYVVPLQIGARSAALPRVTALAWWLYLAGGLTIYATFLYSPSGAGQIPFPPLSDDVYSAGSGVDAWLVGVSLAVTGLVLAALNLAVTVSRMRAPGLAWKRTPLFTWASTVLSYMLLVAGPVLIAALAMLFFDRNFDGVFFDPDENGAPILFQHLAYFFFTAAYLGIVVFAAGVISEIVANFARKPIFSHFAIAGSMVAIAAIGIFAWMQNMYSADLAIGFDYFAMIVAISLLVPFGLLFFNWIATLWKGSLEMRAPLLFALGAISMMSFGLAGELGYSVIPVGWQLNDTAAAWQDTHYALIGGSVMGGFAALYYWFPKMTGRRMSEGLGRLSFWKIFISSQLLLMPMFFAGLAGQPSDISEYADGSGLFGWNLVSAIGAIGLAAGVILTLANAARSVHSGTVAGPDPWGGSTLEWFALSPPAPHNFDAVPDVRSEEPMADIRRAVKERDFDVPAPPAPRPEPEPEAVAEPEPQPEPEPVAEPEAAPAMEAESESAPADPETDEADDGDGGGAPVA